MTREHSFLASTQQNMRNCYCILKFGFYPFPHDSYSTYSQIPLSCKKIKFYFEIPLDFTNLHTIPYIYSLLIDILTNPFIMKKNYIRRMSTKD